MVYCLGWAGTSPPVYLRDLSGIGTTPMVYCRDVFRIWVGKWSIARVRLRSAHRYIAGIGWDSRLTQSYRGQNDPNSLILKTIISIPLLAWMIPWLMYVYWPSNRRSLYSSLTRNCGKKVFGETVPALPTPEA
jgi:hypothetical protein